MKLRVTETIIDFPAASRLLILMDGIEGVYFDNSGNFFLRLGRFARPLNNAETLALAVRKWRLG